MTSLDSEPQVDDQTVIMEDVSVPILTDQEKCAMLTSLEKQSRVLSARKDYVTDMTEIENAIPSKTEDVRQQLEEEAANLDEKIKFLEGKMSVLLPCPVPLCKHNFKYKSNRKRMAELIIKPAKLNPKLYPKIAKTEENKTNDFKIPRKTAKSIPVETNTEIPTNNSFAALNTANKDAEEVITPKIRPIMMKLFNNYNLVLQNLHKTHPTATNTHVGGGRHAILMSIIQSTKDLSVHVFLVRPSSSDSLGYQKEMAERELNECLHGTFHLTLLDVAVLPVTRDVFNVDVTAPANSIRATEFSEQGKVGLCCN
ncbi:uncharacterized protein TNCT_293101 [Trichonephila clavata]|uniref:Uncharacterized protein n=1 Tax=Trichonephila clavata TaxID=2740835 RepID=A0A8X6LN67_TRICU|nr:uncharacterized protein TNCT_293101 [Trichonephila clavata]